jgi:hypothetical protein
MRKAIVLVAVLGALAIQISSEAQAQQLSLVITSEYYAQPKTLILHVLNNSGKDITGYMVTIRQRNLDGSVDMQGWSGATSDMLLALVDIQMAKDPVAEEHARRENGTGLFATGTTLDITMPNVDGPGVAAAAAAVFYADGSFDKPEENAFKQLLAIRQGQLLAMKKINEIIRDVLVDPANDHPVAAAITELAKYTVAAMSQNHNSPYDPELDLQMHLQNAIQSLRSMQQPQKGTTERERLTKYVEEQEKRVELMTPHCHLEIVLKQ